MKNHFNKYQQEWALAKARVDASREFQRLHGNTPQEYEKLGRTLVAALEDFAIATKALLVFARGYVEKNMPDHPMKDKALKLYDAPIQEYLNPDELPTYWASKVIDSTMRTDFNK